ncbi:anaphase-promoting complex subunit 6 isoform X2 [Citrus clementina]|uniref:anaphase-promoting complex subunit 6 isoform X2 n=1 Tax=Citrus clementina TaxID=85681 RepID=UPI000CED1EFF|nr:anaphase-promoting complex subunit 6 isoform X2 [Citrus x clementina]
MKPQEIVPKLGCGFGMPYRKSHANMRASKATNLDGTFAPAWIGYGNAFAAQEEGDQAMLGYRTAACLFPGLNLDVLLFQVPFTNFVYWNGVHANSQL